MINVNGKTKEKEPQCATHDGSTTGFVYIETGGRDRNIIYPTRVTGTETAATQRTNAKHEQTNAESDVIFLSNNK